MSSDGSEGEKKTFMSRGKWMKRAIEKRLKGNKSKWIFFIDMEAIYGLSRKQLCRRTFIDNDLRRDFQRKFCFFVVFSTSHVDKKL